MPGASDKEQRQSGIDARGFANCTLAVVILAAKLCNYTRTERKYIPGG